MCIWVVGGGNCWYVCIGDIIIVVVKDVFFNMVVKKLDVVRVVVVCIKKGLCWDSGMSIRFDDNVVVIIN